MSGIKQAALSIHGLSVKDQKWILKQLPKQHALSIRSMLRELKSLGIPGRHGWLPEIQIENEKELNEQLANEKQIEELKLVEKASISQLKKLLLAESNDFIAAVLSIRQWPWQEQMLNIFSKKRRMALLQIMERKESFAIPKRTTESVLSILAEQLEMAD